MKKGVQLWCFIMLVLLALFPTLNAQESVDDDPRLEAETTLDEKFSEGNYSRRGAEGCLRCHDDESEHPASGIFANVHGKMANIHGPMQDKQCEACHGPAGNHARSPRKGQLREPMITFGPDSPVPAEKQNNVCLSCHQDTQRASWHSSEHAFEGLSCSSCHQVHKKQDPMLDAGLQIQTCTTCHSQTKADLHKRTSHPMLNGTMQCSDCHNPHQSINEFSLNQPSVNAACYDCHAEKRGPFLWEHEPVSEDCTACHTPHGSVNQAMLKQRLPQLCQSCHQVPHANVEFAANDLRVLGGSCLNCHSQVHGSSHPRGHALRN